MYIEPNEDRIQSVYQSSQIRVSALFSKVNLVIKKSLFLHADSEDPDQTGRMVRADYNLYWETKAIWLAASCSFTLRFPLTAV